jgi:lysozyme
MLNGIDVSYWQGIIDWPLVRQAGIAFAYVRASQGNSYEDPNFTANVSGAQKANILVGSYHFFQYANSAQDQAKWFLSKIAPYQLDLPVALDIEDTTMINKAGAAASIKTWLDLVEHGTGHKPIIYTNANSWDTYVGNPAWAPNYSLWVANWTAGAEPSKPKSWNSWTFWQHSNQGQIQGINGNVDLDRCNLNMEELLIFCGKMQNVVTSTLEERVAALESTVIMMKEALKAKAIL